MRPTAKRVRELFCYDKDSGELTRKVSRGNVKAGAGVGSISHGYLLAMVDGRTFGIHRIIWLIMTGHWPLQIDHRDRNGLNNRWNNLREATHAQNMMNKLYPNLTGFKGVSIRRACVKRPFVARISAGNKKWLHLGNFKTAKEAHAAYVAAAQTIHGEFARPS